ncbi:hypothetical protein ACHAXA_005995 [Cyclostephanos tholiformis]|uniref:Helicase-associated domain-containing protein n=1 Tax=Cyclostephanos tholiformis TaxID=382380 RepID=A0ABD3SRC0_9STRA
MTPTTPTIKRMNHFPKKLRARRKSSSSRTLRLVVASIVIVSSTAPCTAFASTSGFVGGVVRRRIFLGQHQSSLSSSSSLVVASSTNLPLGRSSISHDQSSPSDSDCHDGRRRRCRLDPPSPPLAVVGGGGKMITIARTREEDLELTRITIMTGSSSSSSSSSSLCSSTRGRTTWEQFIDGLVAYKKMHGHVLVPASFVIPRRDNDDGDGTNDGIAAEVAWPPHTHGVPLGGIVQRLRMRRDFLTGLESMERRVVLDELGFVWDVGEWNFDRFVVALRYFDKLEGGGGAGGGGGGSDGGNNPSSLLSSRRERRTSIRVPSKFVVPRGREYGWPSDLWDYPLGAKTLAVRQKELYIRGYPHRKQLLEEIGFRWKNGNAAMGWLDVVHAAAIYSQMHGRSLNVPLNFVVPSPPPPPPPPMANNDDDDDDDDDDGGEERGCHDSWPWPERLWGLKLGQRLKDVRLKGAYLKGPDAQLRRAQLDNLGFVWNPKRGRMKRFIEGG